MQSGFLGGKGVSGVGWGGRYPPYGIIFPPGISFYIINIQGIILGGSGVNLHQIRIVAVLRSHNQ